MRPDPDRPALVSTSLPVCARCGGEETCCCLPQGRSPRLSWRYRPDAAVVNQLTWLRSLATGQLGLVLGGAFSGAQFGASELVLVHAAGSAAVVLLWRAPPRAFRRLPPTVAAVAGLIVASSIVPGP